MNYREKQRDFEARAKAVTLRYYSGPQGTETRGNTCNDGKNAKKRAFQVLRDAVKGKEGGWKKRIRLLLIRAKQEGHIL